MANRFDVPVLGGMDVGRELRMNRAESQQRAEQQRQLQEQRDQRIAFKDAIGGSPEAMERLAEVSPQMFMQMEARNTKRRQTEGGQVAKAKNDAELEYAGRYRAALDRGDDQALIRLKQEAVESDLIDFENQGIGEDRDQDYLAINSVLFKGHGKDLYREIYSGVDREKPVGQLEFESLISDFTPEQQKKAKMIKAGLKGRAMSNAVLSAIESGDVKNLAEAQATIKQAEKFASLTGASRAKAIDKGFDSIVKIDTGIRNIDRAISALDRGAGVGAVEKIWPSIKAASVELDNIRGQMALDVVGATTFGALSKGELDLAKDIALPTGLDTPELVDYLTRKKTAQEKLKAYYNEQIQFLDQGGTVAGFLRQKESDQGQDQQPSRLEDLTIDQLQQLSDEELQRLLGVQ